MPQWITRNTWPEGQCQLWQDRLVESAVRFGVCDGIGQVDGNLMPKGLLQVQYQPEVGFVRMIKVQDLDRFL